MSACAISRWTARRRSSSRDSPRRPPACPTAPAPGFTVQVSDFEVARLFESGGPLLVLASFLGFGVLLAFTPCVLPMMPILSGIIVGEGRSLGKLRALLLSLAYVLGMAVAYAAAGVAAAWSGTLLAAALQNAWVLGAFALVFVGLALSMFGFYELQLPGFLHHRLHATHGRLRGGQHRLGRRDGCAVGGHREPLRGGAARRCAALHQPDAGCCARRLGAVRDGARHGHSAAGGRCVGRRACCRGRGPGWCA